MKSQKIECLKRIKEVIKVILEQLFYFILGSIIFSFIFNKCQSFYSYNGVILNYATSNSKLIDKEPYDKNTLYNDSLDKFEKELIIFNAGDDYLDFSRILNDRKVKFTFNGKVENLKLENTNPSRSDLKIDVQIQDKNSIVLQFPSNEALEATEGIQIFLSYYGDENITINQKNRIKGIPNGFKKVGYGYFASQTFWSLSLNSFLLILGVVLIILAIWILISNNSKWKWVYFLLFMMIGLILFIITLTHIDFKKARNIEWLVENLIINQHLITWLHG